MKKYFYSNILLLATLFSFLFSSCDNDFSTLYPYQPPEQIGDGLEVGTLDQVNIDTEMIAKAVGRIQQEKYREVHSMLIFRNDILVFEEYYTGHRYEWGQPNFHGELVNWNRDELHNVASVTKSITSA